MITGLLDFIPGMANVGILRTFRLLRPLRSLAAIPSMKVVVNTLFNSISQLVQIILLNMFFILIFAIFGLQMWTGVINYRCRMTPYPMNGDW